MALNEGLCQCEDCVPNPTDKSTMIFQAVEGILDILTVRDCTEDERERIEERLEKLITHAKKL